MMSDLKMNVNEYLPLRDVVFKTLREAILKGNLAPGERLMEIQLEGLVIMIPRRGAEVARITEKDLKDVLEVRTSLEELAISLACERISDASVEALKEALKNFKAAINGGDVTKIAESDVAFHDIIFAATDNARLIQIVNNLREQMYRYRLEYLKDYTTHDRLYKEHEEIVAAIADRDKALARKLIVEHIYHQELTVIKNIQE